jgi:flagellar motor switch protein FliN/FliY
MPSQEEIDAILREAQGAVDDLADTVDELTGPDGGADVVSPPPQAAAPAPAQPQERSSAAAPPVPARPLPPGVDRILKLRVPLVVRLAERPMLLGDVLQVVPGTVLEFSRTVDEDLDLLVNNRQIGKGVAVKVNERFGIRITFIGDVKQRITSLAG